MSKNTAVPAKKPKISASPWYDKGQYGVPTRVSDALDEISEYGTNNECDEEVQAVWNYIVELIKRVPDWHPKKVDTKNPPDLPMEVRDLVDEIRYRLEEDDDAVAIEYIPKLLEWTESLGAELAELKKPLEFEYAPGRPLMVVKLGEASKGWVPNAAHFAAVRKVLKAAGEDKRNNILLYNYGIMIERHESGVVVK